MTNTAARLAERYPEVRRTTESLCARLTPEDHVVQSMPDASPAKWHLAHTSWFFETFLLGPHLPGYAEFHPRYGYLFNSYYNAVGDRHERPRRGILSRPPLEEIHAYRRHVDGRMAELFAALTPERAAELAPLIALGLNHEQQHQELILMDIKHAFASEPLRPAYVPRAEQARSGGAPALRWVPFGEGVRRIGDDGKERFAFDNEGPRHRVFTEPFQLASRPVTCGEFRAFIDDGGYRRPEFWLSDGWDAVRANGWEAPLYWEDGAVMTLSGVQPFDDAEPVCHVSFYEADAFARWAGARLPTEAEWEVAAVDAEVKGNLLERGRLHPAAADGGGGSGALGQLFGDVWEWTASAYSPYPGFRPAAGAVGEYNGKFMCNQLVLRGGACVTPASHLRATYRNFFPPHARWAFSGLRLARDGG